MGIFSKNNFIGDTELVKIFGFLFQDFVKIYSDYFMKIEKFCYIQNGFNNSKYYLLDNIILYEQLGIIAITGLNHYYLGTIHEDKNIISIAEKIKKSLKAFIVNHPSISSPVYDNHIIEIVLSLILLINFGEIEFIEKWLIEIVNRVGFSYKVLKKYFPVDSDSLEDAVLISSFDEKDDKENMMKTTTLLMILLQFSAILELDSAYKFIKKIINKYFKESSLQIWFPDDTTDNFIYVENAGYRSGLAVISTSLPESFEDMNKIILESNKKYMDKNSISAIKKGFMILPLIASRHFRTPILPLYWSMFINDKNSEENQSQD